MKRRQYRIVGQAPDGDGKMTEFFPQVRFDYKLWWGVWYKIAKHPGNSYGLYPKSNKRYPETFESGNQVIKDYEAWYVKKDQGEEVIIPVTLIK